MIEFARSMLGLADAHSAEFDAETKNALIVFMPEVSRTQVRPTQFSIRWLARATVLHHNPQSGLLCTPDAISANSCVHLGKFFINHDDSTPAAWTRTPERDGAARTSCSPLLCRNGA